MSLDMSWRQSAEKYVELYRKIRRNRPRQK